MTSDTELISKLKTLLEDGTVDPVTLTTIIDDYCEQINKENNIKQKTNFLTCLAELLEINYLQINEIGWDLPKILLKFICKENIATDVTLNDDNEKEAQENQLEIHKPLINVIKDFFKLLQKYGSAKESLIATCELIISLNKTEEFDKIEESKINELKLKEEEKNGEPGEINASIKINEDSELNDYDRLDVISEEIIFIKLELLTELLEQSLMGIKTNNPSKFLAIGVSAYVKFITANSNELSNINKLLNIVYSFCSKFVLIDNKSKKIEDSNNEELHKIVDDENILEKKLLLTLLSFAVEKAFISDTIDIPINLIRSTENLTPKKMVDHLCFENPLMLILLNILKLMENLGADFNELFENYLAETRAIYSTLPNSETEDEYVDNDSANQVIYQLPYTFLLQKMDESKTLNLHSNGVLILSTILFLSKCSILDQIEKLDITADDLVCMYLRNTTPSLFSALFQNEGAESCVYVWLASGLYVWNQVELTQQFKAGRNSIIQVFFQLLLIKIINESDDTSRMNLSNVFLDFASVVPEEVAFNFILDTLLTCPFPKGKIFSLNALKELMLKARSIKHIENDSQKNMPPLPPRPHIQVTDDRKASIHSLAIIAIGNASKPNKDKLDLVLLLEYINFFISLQKKWDSFLLDTIYEELKESFPETAVETFPEVGFIKISTEILGNIVKN
ncbi:hypothetical protein TBLA_0F02460 [Henningerozyma blattae CBS 6284]|uniref:Uncharacterized protein n=1 Tax=Henningerozyma blattae (strain ATCC 34711 / CBS 6284 / DSM 70876 / NBRC 10599 / NRRL Y-10934 / UCD 77-7) TaxID=1071380 RepID=I2H5Y4_HENB6|nr:hypothetical protein TBLA_0F02460 [Tetrapisispora blattae CBS 6284]CCH61786.1 hypothetical protein TBLA_0F02460 [Tetrapisispora blattae CBS 6284]